MARKLLGRFLFKVTPPIIVDLFRNLLADKRDKASDPGMFRGNYISFQDAALHAKGYGDTKILEKVSESILKVKNGEAVYERDSCLFEEIQYSWPLVASLQHIALKNKGKLTIVDFGGSLGSSFFQNKYFIERIGHLNWNVVEQPKFVETGNQIIKQPNLNFFETIDDAVNFSPPHAILLSGVLQYLEHPEDILKLVSEKQIEYLILDRTCFTEGRERFLLQIVPPEIYEASYACRFFLESKLLSIIQADYKLISSWDSYADPVIYTTDNIRLYWKGFLFERKK